MKKIFALFVAGASVLTANAQAVEGHKLFDNWSVGLIGGGATPVKKDMIKNTRGVAGLELKKDITPMFGLGLQSMAGFNTTGSYTAVDNINTTLFGTANLSNIFFGYKGKPRTFETEALFGFGFNHFFGGNTGYAAADGNSATSKVGLNFNFNLGEKRAWTLSVRPALVYNLEGGESRTPVQYNINNAVLELTAGVVYHFNTSTGKHYFVPVRPYDKTEIDALNAKINDLRAQLKTKEGELNANKKQLRETQEMLNDCRNQKPAVQIEKVVNTKNLLESVVTFRQGKTTIDASQLPNVERIATYMKNHKEAKVNIIGYASPEGSAEINARIAQARAEAVKTLLVNKYHIAADRISAKGQGVGNLFSEPDWNRVSICTLNEEK